MSSPQSKRQETTVQEGHNKEVKEVGIEGATSKEHLDIPSSVDHCCKHTRHAGGSTMEKLDSYEDHQMDFVMCLWMAISRAPETCLAD